MALVLFKRMLFMLSMSIGAKHTDFSTIGKVAILPMTGSVQLRAHPRAHYH